MRSMIVAAFAASAALLLSPQPGNAEGAPPALQGQVSSAAEGAMEGVVVTAKRADSPISVSVVSDAKGHYAFPAGRLAPGHYALSIRAAGYDLDGSPGADVNAATGAAVDLKLKKTKDLTAQLTNTEWTFSAPGTDEQKAALLNCTACHTVERIFKSTHDTAEFEQVMTRMAGYAPGSMPAHPQRRILLPPEAQNPARFEKPASYLASINLSKSESWDYPLKTLPRPTGKATRVIVTEYQLPRTEAMPHDVVMDKDGIVWYSDFGSQYLGSLDPRTGKVVDYAVPTLKPQDPKGLLDVEFDQAGNIWVGMMLQAGIAKFDRTTHQFQTWALPKDLTNDLSQQAMVVPYREKVDGRVWMNDVGSHALHRVNLRTSTFDTIEPFASMGPGHDLYGIFADKENNLYGSDFADIHDARLVGVDAKTGKVTFYPIPTPYARPRRGRIDGEDRIFFAEYRGDKVAMFDTKTDTFKEWPTPAGTWPYDVIWDKDGNLWTGGMSNDRIVRINMKTGETTAYLMPHELNVRRVYIDDRTEPPTFWVGSHHTHSIFKLEPLE